MSEGERRLAAIMFTDMVGYTALGQRNESLSLALVEEQRKLIRPILARHNGREIKTMGDAFLVEFPSALDAVRCAYDIQRATREFNISLPVEKRIHLRVGLHLGDVVESQGDISGDAVNVASRTEPLAEDGGVCLTRQVFDHVQNKFELPFTNLGPKTLKNVNTPVEVYKMVMPWEQQFRSKDAVPLPSDRIAVLPFTSLSPTPEDEYFADGMTEELISTLSRIRNVEVISRTSVMQYKKALKPVKDISAELGAGTLLEGSVRKAGDRIRVTIQMIDAPRDRHLWAESYDRDLHDVFAIQSDIAQRVAKVLEARLLEGDAERIEHGLTDNVQAYDAYLRGLYEMHRMTDYSLRNCISHLEEAVRLDESFAAAYASLGNAFVHAAGEEDMAPDVSYKRGKELIEKALVLDESLSTAHSARGNLAAQYEWDWDLAEKEVRRAIELNPSNSEAHRYYSTLLDILKRSDECEREAQKAMDLDPLWWVNEMVLAWRYVRWRRFDEAIIHARRCVDLDPENPNALLELGRVYFLTGRLDEGLEQAKKSLNIKGTLEGKALLAMLYASKGMREMATSILKEIERESEHRYFSPFRMGEIHLALGENERALEFFERAYERHSFDFIIFHQSPDLDAIRQDSRFIGLLRRYNLSL